MGSLCLTKESPNAIGEGNPSKMNRNITRRDKINL